MEWRLPHHPEKNRCPESFGSIVPSEHRNEPFDWDIQMSIRGRGYEKDPGFMTDRLLQRVRFCRGWVDKTGKELIQGDFTLLRYL